MPSEKLQDYLDSTHERYLPSWRDYRRDPSSVLQRDETVGRHGPKAQVQASRRSSFIEDAHSFKSILGLRCSELTFDLLSTAV